MEVRDFQYAESFTWRSCECKKFFGVLGGVRHKCVSVRLLVILLLYLPVRKTNKGGLLVWKTWEGGKVADCSEGKVNASVSLSNPKRVFPGHVICLTLMQFLSLTYSPPEPAV